MTSKCEMLKIVLLHPITINGDLDFQASESGIKWFVQLQKSNAAHEESHALYIF